MRRPISALLAAAMLAGTAAVPARGQTTGHIPPGNPCLKNNGNPCNGNNGNLGRQGNADPKTVAIDLAMPPVLGRGAFVEQIGEGHTTSIVQTAPNAFARVRQMGGPGNEADIAQKGSADAYVAADQTGSTQFARIEQDGSGANALWTEQRGTNNWLWSRQTGTGGAFNGARVTQSGNNNDLLLVQNGSDNRAVLTQNGDNNGMTATQLGNGNRLAWEQQGSNLADLQIVQMGGATNGGQLLISQRN